MSKRYKKMLADNETTQKDIDEAVAMKAIIDDAFYLSHPNVSFEMLLLWWLIVVPGVA
jgi:hypothetical protein|tara:strand:+ start:240 stop:413 length:174 start_codon:yes stop_codon:yes gene_type:complete